MIAMRVTSEATVYTPKPDEIVRTCAAYRAGWSAVRIATLLPWLAPLTIKQNTSGRTRFYWRK